VPQPVSCRLVSQHRAGCRVPAPSLPRVRFAESAQGSTPCASRNTLEQSAEVQGAAPIKPQPSQTAAAPPGQGAEVQGCRQQHHISAAAPLLSVRFRGWHQRHHSLLHKQQHLRQGAEVQVLQAAPQPPPRAAAAPPQRAQGSEGADGCLHLRPAWPNGRQHGPQWAELERVDRTPTSHHARSQSKSSPFQRAAACTSPQQTACSSYHAPPPRPLWFLLPTPPSATAAEAPRPQSPSAARPHQACRSTQPTTGGSTKRSMAGPCHASYGLCCHPEPPHRMTISLLAMPLFMCNAAANLDTTGRPLTLKAPSQDLTGHAGRGRVEGWDLGPDGTKTVLQQPQR
jgi:hypothetical protein